MCNNDTFKVLIMFFFFSFAVETLAFSLTSLLSGPKIFPPDFV